MTKEELLAKIKSAELDPKLETLLLEMVESANQVSDELLNIIIDLLDVAAELDEKEIDLLDKEVDVYDEIILALEHMKAEYDEAVASGHAEAYKTALENVQAKIKELSQKTQEPTQPEPQQPPQDGSQNQNPW